MIIQSFQATDKKAILEFILEQTQGEAKQWAETTFKVLKNYEGVKEVLVDSQRVAIALVLTGHKGSKGEGEFCIFPTQKFNREAFAAVVAWGKEFASLHGFAYLDLPLWSACPIDPQWRKEQGFLPHYACYEMLYDSSQTLPNSIRIEALSSKWQWVPYHDRYALSLYQLLTAAFREIPAFFLADFESYRKRCQTLAMQPWLLIEDNKVIGMVRVEKRADGYGEIANIARDPSFQGKKLGPHLLKKGMALLKDAGFEKMYLTVVSSNASAVNLYKNFGFTTTQCLDVDRAKIK